jgi:hypothetical protein
MNQETTFRFPCYREFKTRLGEADAAAQFAEIAVRQLANQCEQSSKPNAALQEKADEFGVKSDYVDPKLARRQITTLHLIAVMAETEHFLEDLRDSHPSHREWEYPKDDEDLLRRIIRNAVPDLREARKELGGVDFDLFEHYRVVRNLVAHGEVQASKVDVRVDKLREASSGDARYARLDAPNTFNNLRFDDFILLTRVAKSLARQLCKLLRPTDEQIVTMVIEKFESPRKSKQCSSRSKDTDRTKPWWMAFQNNVVRQQNALATFLRQEYSLDRDESKPIIQILIDAGR